MKTNTSKPLKIDGAYGEGGGQIIRTSLALSLITGTPIHITNIRAGRKKSGLLRQHLACVKAAKAIGQAKVTGAELGSAEITFIPQTVQSGDYEFAIGSAGSTTLVLQTVLPALMLLEKPSRVTVSGGTHNPMAPPVEYIQNTFVPFLAKLGFGVALTCEQAGFAPLGGGSIRCDISPRKTTETKPLDLTERGELLHINANVILAHVPFHVAEREFDSLKANLIKDDKIVGKLGEFKPVEYNGISQGNMAVATVHCTNHTETFTVLGDRKTSAETVGKRLAGQVKRYLNHSACVDEYTADQLLLPLALTGGGSFTAREISEHTRTQAYMIEQFLAVQVKIAGNEICVSA